jgi:hypothetical protein
MGLEKLGQSDVIKAGASLRTMRPYQFLMRPYQLPLSLLTRKNGVHYGKSYALRLMEWK